MADPDLLGQAVINLLHNAGDAVADVEKPAIELAFTLEDQAVVISVIDNGKGIPAQFREDIFVPFFTTKCWRFGDRAQCGAPDRAQAWRPGQRRHQ